MSEPNIFYEISKHLITSSNLPTLTKIADLYFSKGTNAIYILVIIPRVPSLPIKSCFKSYNVLSFLTSDSMFNILPSGRTTSI